LLVNFCHSLYELLADYRRQLCIFARVSYLTYLQQTLILLSPTTLMTYFLNSFDNTKILHRWIPKSRSHIEQIHKKRGQIVSCYSPFRIAMLFGERTCALMCIESRSRKRTACDGRAYFENILHVFRCKKFNLNFTGNISISRSN
jgi:hypothetical protein